MPPFVRPEAEGDKDEDSGIGAPTKLYDIR